jgi:hypothetical protein
VSDDFLAELARRLESLGVRGAEMERVLAEARNHLEEAQHAGGDPVRRFGDAQQFARLVAVELVTARTRRATFGAFGALALAGAVYALAFALVPAAGGWPDIFAGRVGALGPLIAVAMVLLPQIAFVSGCLALLRALRMRNAPLVEHAQLDLLRRRSNIALGAATGTLVAVVLFALQGELAPWWTWATVAACVVLFLPLGVAARAVSGSVCPAAAPGGETGDVFDDLAPLLRLRPVRQLRLPGHPWRFAVLCAVAVGVAAFAAGWYAEGDPGSGLVRGIFEALALLICFAALGRKLGLRRSKT